jgi:hypothetical protein
MVSFTPRPLTPRLIVPGTHLIGGSVGPRTDLDAEKRKALSCRESNPGCPARIPWLYRLSYPDCLKKITKQNCFVPLTCMYFSENHHSKETDFSLKGLKSQGGVHNRRRAYSCQQGPLDTQACLALKRPTTATQVHIYRRSNVLFHYLAGERN